ncbi:11424_t:CDS:2, partial [Gigaspora rosea]
DDEETFTLEPETNNANPDPKPEEKVAAMIQDLNEERPSTDQKPEKKTSRTLETCYYLGQLLKKFQNNSKAFKEMKNLFKVSFGKRSAYNLWKGAKRTYQLFQH